MRTLNSVFLRFVIVLLFIFSETEGYSRVIHVCFRIDDFGIDNLDVYRKIIPIFKKHNTPITIGVVPYFKEGNHYSSTLSEERISFLRGVNDKYIEIALHGYSHTNYLTREDYYSEFLDQSYSDQFKKIRQGRQVVDSIFGIHVRSFIPPWNTYDSNTLIALENNGFSNISAARYGLIAQDETNMVYMPYSCLIDQIDDAILQARQQKNVDDVIIIVLFHTYNFVEDSNIINNTYSGKSNVMTYSDLDSLLLRLVLCPDIRLHTLDGMSKSYRIDNKTIPTKIFFKDYFFPIPSFLKLNEPLILRNLSSFDVFAFYLMPTILLFGILVLAYLFVLIYTFLISFFRISIKIYLECCFLISLFLASFCVHGLFSLYFKVFIVFVFLVRIIQKLLNSRSV